MDWRPIKTYKPKPFDPANYWKDEPRVLIFEHYTRVGWYGYTKNGKGRWKDAYGIANPTHWMPMPKPPVASND